MGCALKEGQDKPGTEWDYAMLGAVVAASIPLVGANLVVVAHKHRAYFRAQGGALLILTSSASGLVWIAAALVANDHFSRKTPFLHLCSFWTLWAYLVFGLCPWLVCLILRLHHLHALCHPSLYPPYLLRTPTWLKMLLLWSPSIVFVTIATIFRAVKETGNGECKDCQIEEKSWKFSIFCALPLTYYTILVLFLIWCRGSDDYMMSTEHLHTSEYSFMTLIIYLLYGLDVLTKSHRKIPGRCFLTFCVCCLVFFNFWARIGWPLYLCLFKGDSEMDSFEQDLRSCGAECLSKLGSRTGSYRQGRSLSLHGYDWVLKGIDVAMNEASECKEKINWLEQKKTALLARIELPKMSGIASDGSPPSCTELDAITELGCFSSYSRIPPIGRG